MSDDDADKLLKKIVEAADLMSEAHEGHGCVFEAIGEIAGDSARAALAGGRGPAQVATPAYRSSWDRTFSGKPPVRGQA